MELNYKKILEIFKGIDKELKTLEYVVGETNIVENLRNYRQSLFNNIYCEELRKVLLKEE